jgi:bla regulator protein BlaR1
MGISINNESIKEVTYMKWTKGIVVHYGDKTASHYSIVSMNGSEYMFFEWKSGDYVFRHMKPYYYVLKKIK